MSAEQRQAAEWYEQASHWYSEKHQGCPWCKGVNRVYRTERGLVTEFRCGGCGFLASCNCESRLYVMGPGRNVQGPLTMISM